MFSHEIRLYFASRDNSNNNNCQQDKDRGKFVIRSACLEESYFESGNISNTFRNIKGY